MDTSGGVGSGHSPTGYHPKGMAIDVTDWRPDVAPAYAGGKEIPWQQRTGELSWRAKQLGLFNEALGPYLIHIARRRPTYDRSQRMVPK